MDVMRSAYRVNMRFTPGGPLVPVQWYFAKPGAKVFGDHGFMSLNWEDDPELPGAVGEDRGTSPSWFYGWSPSTLNGKCPKCYDPSLFGPLGMPTGLLFDNPVDSSNVPAPCWQCQQAQSQLGDVSTYVNSCGGLIVNGSATVNPPCNCTNVPLTLYAHLVATGDVITLTFDPIFERWGGSAVTTVCGSLDTNVAIYCDAGLTDQFLGALWCGFTPPSFQAPSAFTCYPFSVTYSGLMTVDTNPV
jgi:hypothetical protein